MSALWVRVAEGHPYKPMGMKEGSFSLFFTQRLEASGVLVLWLKRAEVMRATLFLPSCLSACPAGALQQPSLSLSPIFSFCVNLDGNVLINFAYASGIIVLIQRGRGKYIMMFYLDFLPKPWTNLFPSHWAASAVSSHSGQKTDSHQRVITGRYSSASHLTYTHLSKDLIFCCLLLIQDFWSLLIFLFIGAI